MLWQEYRDNKENRLKALQKAFHLKPNKCELFLQELLNCWYPSEWKYVGDLSFLIDGKNPDFVNINGKKKLIEFYGDYLARWEKM